MPDITITGPTTINVLGPTLDDLRTIIRAELSAAVTPIKEQFMSEFTDLRDQLAGVFADLAAKIDRLQVAVDSADSATHLTAEDQAVLDEIKAAVAAARATVGDENADGTPPAEPTA